MSANGGGGDNNFFAQKNGIFCIKLVQKNGINWQNHLKGTETQVIRTNSEKTRLITKIALFSM